MYLSFGVIVGEVEDRIGRRREQNAAWASLATTITLLDGFLKQGRVPATL